MRNNIISHSANIHGGGGKKAKPFFSLGKIKDGIKNILEKSKASDDVSQ